MHRPPALLASLLVACAALFITTHRATAADAPDYNRDVAPVFRKYCVACHGQEEPEKGLILDSHAALMKGGAGGAAIAPGSSERSRLFLMMTGRAEPVMPPKDNEAPTKDEVAAIGR